MKLFIFEIKTTEDIVLRDLTVVSSLLTTTVSTIQNYTLHLNYNSTSASIQTDKITKEWPVLILSVFVIIGAVGNILVCLSIALYPKLQNATNYYLFSLAATDLLVSIIVIPLAILKVFNSNLITSII